MYLYPVFTIKISSVYSADLPRRDLNRGVHVHSLYANDLDAKETFQNLALKIEMEHSENLRACAA